MRTRDGLPVNVLHIFNVSTYPLQCRLDRRDLSKIYDERELQIVDALPSTDNAMHFVHAGGSETISMAEVAQRILMRPSANSRPTRSRS